MLVVITIGILNAFNHSKLKNLGDTTYSEACTSYKAGDFGTAFTQFKKAEEQGNAQADSMVGQTVKAITLQRMMRLLTANNAIALRMGAADNAFTLVQQLVSSTVAGDSSIVRGIYMDAERRPWVNATKTNPEGAPESFDPLSSEIDLWSASQRKDGVYIKTFVDSSIMKSGEPLFEVCAPVISYDSTFLGHIRYAFVVR